MHSWLSLQFFTHTAFDNRFGSPARDAHPHINTPTNHAFCPLPIPVEPFFLPKRPPKTRHCTKPPAPFGYKPYHYRIKVGFLGRNPTLMRLWCNFGTGNRCNFFRQEGKRRKPAWDSLSAYQAPARRPNKTKKPSTVLQCAKESPREDSPLNTNSAPQRCSGEGAPRTA